MKKPENEEAQSAAQQAYTQAYQEVADMARECFPSQVGQGTPLAGLVFMCGMTVAEKHKPWEEEG